MEFPSLPTSRGASYFASLLALAALIGGLAGCASNEQEDCPSEGQQLMVDYGFQPMDSETLHRLIKLSDQIYSGAEPKVEQAFADLQAMGIKTIVGVDSARPKLEWAAKYGMEYVHVPIGYDGVTDEQALAFAHVMEKKKGPIYFHCHHGRHRGPAAAAIAFMSTQSVGTSGGVAVLEAAQTSPNYPGLWRDIKAFEPPKDYSAKVDLPQSAGVDDFNSAMAAMDRAWDEVKLVKKAGWKVSAEHPDLEPKHTALILAQTFEQLHAATPKQYAGEAVFGEQMKISLDSSAQLQAALTAGDTDQADLAYTAIGKSCKKCHFEYRDQ